MHLPSLKSKYMFGPAFLVNPVTNRFYSLPNSGTMQKTRKVYLPKSANWYDFWTRKLIRGGQTIDAPAPIGIIPLFIKAGSIVPLGPDMQYATEKAADPLEIRVYTGADAEFTLYEDESDSYNYEQGQFATIDMNWNEAARTLTISNRKGDFPGMLKNRTFRIVWVKGQNGVGIELARLAEIVQYSGEKLIILK